MKLKLISYCLLFVVLLTSLTCSDNKHDKNSRNLNKIGVNEFMCLHNYEVLDSTVYHPYTPPMFKGGKMEFKHYVQKYIDSVAYQSSFSDSIRVYLNFDVGEKGEIINPKVVKVLNGDLINNESCLNLALEIIQSTNEMWVPSYFLKNDTVFLDSANVMMAGIYIDF